MELFGLVGGISSFVELVELVNDESGVGAANGIGNLGNDRDREQEDCLEFVATMSW